MKTEFWKQIKGYEGSYEISSMGRVKSYPKGNQNKIIILKTRHDKDGYLRLKLCKDGMRTDFKIHTLVCTAFHGTPIGNKNCVNHIDGNKENNSADNLEWVSAIENSNHARENGLYRTGESCFSSKLTEIEVIKIRELYPQGGHSYKTLAKMFNVSEGAIEKIIRRKSWKYI